MSGTRSPASQPLLTIVIPSLNEGDVITRLLQQLQSCRLQGHELVLADGGSSDDTVALAEPLVDRVVHSAAGRAEQMNRGAALATNEILWFLHADSRLPPAAVDRVVEALTREQHRWGRFDITLSGRQWPLRLVEGMMNWRSRLTGIATGDQGIFVERQLFQEVGGFSPIPLMEDVQICSTLRRFTPPCCLTARIRTSSRRWERNGIYRTIWQMWYLRLAFALGADPARLAQRYRQCSSPTLES